MRTQSRHTLLKLVPLWLVTALAGCALAPAPRAVVGVSQAEVTADVIRSLERKRLRALVDGDTLVAGSLLSNDFQLVNPIGETFSRRQYLDGIASGFLHYAMWQPDSIAVHVHGDAAVIRYKARLVMVVAGRDTVRPFAHWHTDLYERRNGQWQVVWSQATAIR